MNSFSYIDTHSHLHDEAFDADRDKVIAELLRENIATITVGTDLENSRKAATLAENHPHIWVAIGQHPVDRRDEVFQSAAYETLLHERVVAIGECGIDYFRLAEFSGNKDRESDRQKTLFEEQMHFAAEHDLPLMIHGRPEKGTMDAYEDILHILKNGQKNYGEKVRGDVHFFVGNIDVAREFLDIGFTLSFSGVITFTHEYDEVVRFLPLKSILAETDSPYVAPVPYRGKRNEPAYVREVVKTIATLKGVSQESAVQTMAQTFERVFLNKKRV